MAPVSSQFCCTLVSCCTAHPLRALFFSFIFLAVASYMLSLVFFRHGQTLSGHDVINVGPAGRAEAPHSAPPERKKSGWPVEQRVEQGQGRIGQTRQCLSPCHSSGPSSWPCHSRPPFPGAQRIMHRPSYRLLDLYLHQRSQKIESQPPR